VRLGLLSWRPLPRPLDVHRSAAILAGDVADTLGELKRRATMRTSALLDLPELHGTPSLHPPPIGARAFARAARRAVLERASGQGVGRLPTLASTGRPSPPLTRGGASLRDRAHPRASSAARRSRLPAIFAQSYAWHAACIAPFSASGSPRPTTPEARPGPAPHAASANAVLSARPASFATRGRALPRGRRRRAQGLHRHRAGHQRPRSVRSPPRPRVGHERSQRRWLPERARVLALARQELLRQALRRPHLRFGQRRLPGGQRLVPVCDAGQLVRR